MPSKIVWCHETISPIVGCTHKGEGCTFCYAERTAKRLKAMGQPQYQSVVDENGWTGEFAYPLTQLKRFKKLLRRRKGSRIFLSSMNDFFHAGVNKYVMHQVLDTINDNPCSHHTVITTTKRAKNMAKDMSYYYCIRANEEPLPNLHLGISVSIQDDYDKNVQHLLDTPAAVRWLSYEPALESIDFDLRMHPPCSHKGCYNHISHPCEGCGRIGGRRAINWLVCGCESGPHHRPMKTEWAIDVMQQCREAGIPFFMKQMVVDGRVTDDMSKFPPELQVREYPR